ncbi:hypothetical protein CRV00_09940 [Malaciobacter molluscorum]|uniref:hypothetical protein n=1 Tax=Malaciobacter molluscorum TaxID=1032072 RepID=UPI00100B6E1F|nr:hypothetical protein [Malaciobacter molluscorum]RXJ93773.1 hypothetical protein CRV00_09940 [Malaciobacter molluscorum]
MALKQCNECKKEISTTVIVCPNCGSKRPFKGVKLSREETKELSSKERKSFEKAGGKVTTGIFEKLMNLILAIIILSVIVTIIAPKSAQEIEKEKIEKAKEIKKIEQTTKSIPAREVEKNLKAYKQLSNYYPNNKKYKEKKAFYESRMDMAGQCQIMAKNNNRKTLNNPSTYEYDLLDDNYLEIKWISINEYEFQTSYFGKNAFGVKQKLVSRYQCNFKDGKVYIKKLFTKKGM